MSETLTPPDDPTPEAAAQAPAPEPPAAVPPQPAGHPAAYQGMWAPPYGQPYLEPRQAKRSRLTPRVRVALRWTSLLLVFAVVGAGTAYGVTRPERTRIPGLKTPADGRWTYPELALPGLPPHKPRPLDAKHNRAGVHYADLRTLLVPEPEKAVTDPSFPGAKGWLPAATYLKVNSEGNGEPQQLFLTENGLRHIAARAWTMPDGTRAEIYLVQFISTAYAQLIEQDMDSRALNGVLTDKQEKSLAHMVPHGIDVAAYSETKPYGASMTRYALLSAGDTMAVVRLTRKGGDVPMQAFTQTVVLQAQMLG